MANLLRNGDFERDWSEERSQQCLRLVPGRDPELIAVDSVLTPPGWLVWFRQEEGEWGRPEGRGASEAERSRSGERGYALFVSGQRLDAGLMQQVHVGRGARLRFSAWAHAWSNHEALEQPDEYPHPDDVKWSEGAGYDSFFSLAGNLDDHQKAEKLRNVTFWVGIDPQGGQDPLSDNVVWGSGAHIYNVFAQVPPVEATAEADTITVFTRAQSAMAYKHNRVYWDDARLSLVDNEEREHSEQRGQPRIQYERFYVLLPPGANAEWAHAVIAATWDSHRYTVGGSADDAGIGDLDSRIVLTVNPEAWGGSGVMREFFAEHYPGVRYRTLKAKTPEELRELLEEQ
ncbi:MAG: hypothetical protein R3300_02365 [Candidatus Promineifilaceae bacterium]|nr:hypothetical protein [Candidatus Promineifilaceae bacterium]